MKQNKDIKTQPKMLTPEQLQKRKKMVVFPFMFAVFALAIYFIFKPSPPMGKEKKGFNSDLPVPKNEIIGDKKTAYEMEFLATKKHRQTLSLKDYGVKTDSLKSKVVPGHAGRYVSPGKPQSSVRSSAESYKKVNRDLHNFYDQSQAGSREKELEKQVKKLQAALEEKEEGENPGQDERQLRIMEESYKMAAKYMPSVQGPVQPTAQQPNKVITRDAASNENKNIAPVSRLAANPASALPQQVSDSAFLDRFTQSSRARFYTAGTTMNNKKSGVNTMLACIHNEQVIVTGQSVRLRLLEPLKAGKIIIPENELITGIATIQGERLSIVVSSLEYRGRIIPVKISVYDLDGQPGIFIPGSQEVTALKEVTASMGQGTGTSISITQGTTAGQQLAADLGRSLIQGASQYVSKKLRTTKVTLKAGYRLLLMPSN